MDRVIPLLHAVLDNRPTTGHGTEPPIVLMRKRIFLATDAVDPQNCQVRRVNRAPKDHEHAC